MEKMKLEFLLSSEKGNKQDVTNNDNMIGKNGTSMGIGSDAVRCNRPITSQSRGGAAKDVRNDAIINSKTTSIVRNQEKYLLHHDGAIPALHERMDEGSLHLAEKGHSAASSSKHRSLTSNASSSNSSKGPQSSLKQNTDRMSNVAAQGNRSLEQDPQVDDKQLRRDRKCQEEDEKELKKHRCTVCSRRFDKTDQLRRHDRIVHRHIRPYICTLCDQSFGTKQNMEVHRNTRKHQRCVDKLQMEGKRT